ncbi:hypothetical protein N7495_000914 [Penicillium taxi]|uniref:uncharacterized protein n=1 Tax=Penicillium taxi TaxID=168475 RepID=UPI0025454C09|nr:uncharacterized protein N7495_000914 [Penicillium taxi]KAJ5908232.1 hypothetical protein N7495_000914 [Penicillium taxi]
MAQCKALTANDTMWDFCPSIVAAYIFVVIFGLTTVTHVGQAIIYRKFYCWVISMSGFIQFLTYIFRIISINNPASYGNYAAWFVLILIAPLWTNAFVYMVMGRMVWNFTDDARIGRVRPWWLGVFFVTLDIIALIVQVYGAAQAAGNHISYDTQMTGLHIYMAGVGIQQFFVLVFIVFAIIFHHKVLQQKRLDASKALWLLYVLYTCLALVTMRIIFRLCEYSQGLYSSLPRHEAYQYCLDSLPMFLALVMLNVMHPGRVMPGKNSDMPSRKERKNLLQKNKTEVLENEMSRPGKPEAGISPEDAHGLLSLQDVAKNAQPVYDVHQLVVYAKAIVSRFSHRPRRLVSRPLSIPSFYQFSCDQERRSFQFFLVKTAPQLAGDFECAFWERLLLQSAHHEPAIRHITVALGSLHEHFERDAGAPFRSSVLTVHSSFALRQYSRAMRCLMSMPDDSQPLDVCLISCVLFACYEAMRGHYGSAIMHITSGLKILSELRSKQSRIKLSATSSPGRMPYVSIDVLCGLFSRLQAQVTVTSYQSRSEMSNLWPELTIDLDQPMVFNSLADAREILEIYTYNYRKRSTELLHEPIQTDIIIPAVFVTVIKPEAVALRDTSLSILERWSAALDEFLQRGVPLTDRERRGAMVLKLRKIDAFVALDILQPGDAVVDDHIQWDRYCDYFEHIVTLGELINKSYPSSAFSSTNLPPLSSSLTSFSLDLGIIGAMFSVAARCRDPLIRRRAVSVLRAAGVQEGVWNSYVVADFAEKWIEIEEEGLDVVECSADIPASARLSYFLPVFDIDKCSAVVYFSHISGMDTGNVRKEVFQW